MCSLNHNLKTLITNLYSIIILELVYLLIPSLLNSIFQTSKCSNLGHLQLKEQWYSLKNISLLLKHSIYQSQQLFGQQTFPPLRFNTENLILKHFYFLSFFQIPMRKIMVKNVAAALPGSFARIIHSEPSFLLSFNELICWLHRGRELAWIPLLFIWNQSLQLSALLSGVWSYIAYIHFADF